MPGTVETSTDWKAGMGTAGGRDCGGAVRNGWDIGWSSMGGESLMVLIARSGYGGISLVVDIVRFRELSEFVVSSELWWVMVGGDAEAARSVMLAAGGDGTGETEESPSDRWWISTEGPTPRPPMSSRRWQSSLSLS